MNIFVNDVLPQAQNKSMINFSKENGQYTSSNQSTENQIKNGSMFAGNLNIMNQQDEIARKQIEAQKRALKTVMEQYTQDGVIDQNIADRREHQTELAADAANAQKEISKFSGMRQQLKESYEITDDSEEQKNLELLVKSKDPTQSLSKEEIAQLQTMGPITEYQKSALEYNDMQTVWEKRLKAASKGIANENQAIVSINLELLKIHPMVDAQKEAATIMENAAKEVVGMILDDSKDHIDEEFEKNKEEAEALAKKEEEERVAKNDNSKQNSDMNTTEVIQEAASIQDKILAELKSIIDKNKILEEDLKGIVLDEQV